MLKKILFIIIVLLLLLISKLNANPPFKSIFVKDFTILSTKIDKQENDIYIKYRVKGVLPNSGISQVGIIEYDIKTSCDSPFASINFETTYKLNGTFIEKKEINERFFISNPQDLKSIKKLCGR